MSGELSSGAAPEPVGDRRDWVEFVRFALGEERYGLELGRVKRILPDPTVTPVPQSGPAIAGVTSLGSEIPVVVDGRPLLGLPARSPDDESVLLVLDRRTGQPTGLLVDEVAGIDPYHVDDVRPPADAESWEPSVDRRWFRAVVDDPTGGDALGVFDADALVANARDAS
ncbi:MULTISPECIES: chemotaxis protein CheW [Halorussus]|uniref:chemotaxis protein CheW n=1 Tax=Halorussus TaxID=1070314 RepID=UPI00209F5C4F|nr:chemotaxis protein CheW [Halorussus vallis]USZ74509.1 chemotaxis protein CheW [Halorussus vallis]